MGQILLQYLSVPTPGTGRYIVIYLVSGIIVDLAIRCDRWRAYMAMLRSFVLLVDLFSVLCGYG